MLNYDNKTFILIPTYNPDKILLQLVKQLFKISSKKNFPLKPSILIVDDGSNSRSSLEIIKKLKKFHFVTVISHIKNAGKGQSIKTGIKFLEEKHATHIVTADSDGQHSAIDVLEILKQSFLSNKFVLGERNFSNDKVPFKSRIGNLLTSFLLRLFTGKKILDSQTGLRAFPASFFDELIETEGTKYDYEFNALFKVIKSSDFLTTSIETIYFDNNKKSHFRPLMDSLLIYFVFFRHLSVAFTVSLIDLLLIYIAIYFFPFTLTFIIMRLVTVHIYFYFMRKAVFKSTSTLIWQLARFYAIALINIIISWTIFDALFFQEQRSFLLAYFSAACLMYFINFLLQKNFIYK